MIFWTIVLIAIAVLFLFFFISYNSGNPQFWKAATSNPDLAYDWFLKEDCWVVVHPGENKNLSNEFTGPFRLSVPKLKNKTVKIYGKNDCLETSQYKFLKQFNID